jgi:hypothetical protein
MTARPVQYEEFLGYDEKGNPVVLRRSTAHPGISEQDAERQELFAERSKASEKAFQKGGSMRFFCDARELTGPLQRKLA